MGPRWGSVLVVAGAAALVAVGSFLVYRAQSASFGWFAYAPLSNEVYDPAPTFSPGIVLLDGAGQLGAALVVLAVALLAGLVGFRLGRR